MNIKWLKLHIDIFSDEKIKLIRKYPDGDRILVIWIWLLTMAMKSTKKGIIQLADGMPYTDNDLSAIMEIEIKTIQLAMELFQRFNMISITEGGMIEIINFRKHQSIAEIEYKQEKNRQKVANFRERQKQLKQMNDVTVTEVTVTDREEKRRIEKNREEKNREDNTCVLDQDFLDFWTLYDKKLNQKQCIKLWSKLTKAEKETIAVHLPEYVKSTPDKQFRKHPATYLNQKSFNDEIVQPFSKAEQKSSKMVTVPNWETI